MVSIQPTVVKMAALFGFTHLDHTNYLAPNKPEITRGKPALVLAPMEGVTDAPMRAFLSERGGFSYCVSEFLRVSQTALNRKVFYREIPELHDLCRTPSGLPVQIQLLGGDAELMAESARVAVRCGARAVDINFGCPAPTVNRHDGGATLLKYPERIRDIVRAVRDAVPSEFPVSAKLRLGFDRADAIHLNAQRAQEGGASWITIHGRTKTQGYTPPAYWEPIGEVRRALDIPVVANGEIWTIDDFKRCRDQTGSEHYMLGRGALADPSLPHQIARELGIAFDSSRSTNLSTIAQEWVPLIRRFAEVTERYHGPGSASNARVKQWLRFVHLRFPTQWFELAKRAQSLDEMLRILETA